MTGYSYINIQDWMRFNLNLKGNELLIFAIIHGFSQDGESEFHGSLQYLSDWTGATKRGIIKNLKSLVEKGLIIKKEIQKNGIKFCTYITNCKKFTSSELSSPPSELSSPNNIVDNLIYSKSLNISYKKKKFIPPTVEEVQKYIEDINSSIDAQFFVDYYTKNNWKDKNDNPVKNWKLKLFTWDKRDKKYSNKSSSNQCIYSLNRRDDWNDPEIKKRFEGVYEYGD